MGEIKTLTSGLSTNLTSRAMSSSGALNAWELFVFSYGLLPRDIASTRNQLFLGSCKPALTSLLRRGLFVL